MIGTIVTGLAIAGAAILAAIEPTVARRIWTGVADGEPDMPGPCSVCGLEYAAHAIGSQTCPHTADSLTTEQIALWHLRGGSFSLAHDASSEMRLNLRSIGVSWPAPHPDDERRCRERIAAIMNTEEIK